MSHPKARARRARAARAGSLACALTLSLPLGLPLLPLTLAAGPLAAQEAASAVQDVTLTDVVLPLGGAEFRAPKATVSGTRLSRDELAALLRPGAAEPWPARLARLEAASITIPVLVSEHSGPGAIRQTVTYREVTARDVRAGRIAELTAAGAAIRVSGGDKEGSGTYGQIRANDVDLVALTRLYGVPGDGKGTVQRVYAGIQVAEVVYTDPTGTTMRITELQGRDLGGRQIPGGFGGALDAVAVGLGRLEAEGDALPAAERAKLAGAGADLIEAASVGAIEARGLSLSETGPRGTLLIEAERLAYATGPEAGLSLEGLAFTQGETRARFDRLALTGISLAPTLATLRRLADPAAATQAEDARRMMPALGGLTLKGLSLDLPGPAPTTADPLAAPGARADAKPDTNKPGSRPGPAGTPPPATTQPGQPGQPAGQVATHVALRDAALSFGPLRDGVPTAGRLSLSGLVMPAATVTGAPILGALPGYGYRDLDLDLVADLAWDEGRRELALREVAVSGRDMGAVRLTGTVGGVGPEIFSAEMPVSEMLMFTASARTLDLTVENTGLFERFIATQSKALSLKPEELRQEYVSASQFGVPVILGGSAGARAIGTALGQFVQKPGRLVLKARARDAAGLGFADVALARSPAAILDRVEVEAKAE
ncbi:hypothetical protein [Methylobacterium radiodurans]|uniref:Uncharacterized protein n=1 Tax=Methylobacterium radiodurans TaxID=2202828 RepID=A0A2U8VU86_9HYPH|nr:hypothetical protein [Methylobacterium radiodurans]AWN37313.1 hypothetical protein DK427_17565 [Methylobacterium radiodurans]